MKITWLGQAGLLFETGDMKIIVDPYLSDSLAGVSPENRRNVPVERAFLQMEPDVLVFTHDHQDHYDPETAACYLGAGNGHGERKPVTVLSPRSVWKKVRAFGGDHNYVQFNPGTRWTERGVRFEATEAEHSDPCAVGVCINAEGKRYYVTGDTLYNRNVIRSLPGPVDTVFLPINGKGNNMNAEDAARFAEDTGAARVVPLHFGMFDSLTGEELKCAGRVIPEIYKEIRL